jgi:hypothetical protein
MCYFLKDEAQEIRYFLNQGDLAWTMLFVLHRWSTMGKKSNKEHPGMIPQV